MAKRRPSGDGMVRRRDDGRWEGRIVVGHKENGDSIFRYIYADTQKELSVKLRQYIDAYQGADLTEQSSMILAEWLNQWLERIAGTVRDSTLEGYQRYVNLYINPYLGEKQLSKITPADVRELYATLKRKGRVRRHPKYGRRLSDGMVHSIHTVLYSAMKAAQEAQLIVSNPAAEVSAPKVNHKAMQILNEEQLDAFMEVVQKDELWRDFFYTELTTGLRRGEICGLRWDDFDADAGTLNISRTLHVEKGGRLATGGTKTYAGTRTIILPPSTAEILRSRRRLASSVWIFPDLLNPGQPADPNTAYRQMKKLLAQAGLPSIRFHDLRHTFSTHALANGVDAKTLAGILGHTKASFTLDTYTHITGDMQQRAAEIVGGFLTDILGEELKPWQSTESAGTAAST